MLIPSTYTCLTKAKFLISSVFLGISSNTSSDVTVMSLWNANIVQPDSEVNENKCVQYFV